jgi:carboxyl-terminal processing protease
MQHQDPKIGKVYRSENELAMSQPLVVLVDGDTASAAEVLAGALKENRRATLIGQTTYGKGCTQGLLRLPSEAELRSLASATGLEGGTGGIRITIARFYSPTGQPYSGRGVEPDIRASGELVLYQARELAQKLVGMQ